MPEGSDIQEERKYNVWQAIALSLFSRDLYQDVGKRWKGTGFGILFWIVAVLSIFRAVDVQWAANQKVPGIVARIPEFKIEKGVFSTGAQQPYIKEFYETVVVLDTTGKINSLQQIPDIEKIKNGVLITKDQMFMRRVRFGVVEDKAHPLAKMPDFNVTQEKLKHWGEIFVDFVGIFVFFFLVTFWYAAEVLARLLFGLLGVLISEMRHQGVDYVVALRLAVVSHVPILIVSTFLNLCGLPLPWPYFSSFVVSLGFLFFAVVSQENKTE